MQPTADRFFRPYFIPSFGYSSFSDGLIIQTTLNYIYLEVLQHS
ncbi:hypothetical protein NEISUBOT_03796 [Neisseria subflava NJ9703]|uniref:Uncharacterized protein n=1 Tax=Neisseria subflava NJ9703 TaxID=546268 RepID=A0A9W5ISI6_NEISU|nr:hypothetical protein NEISUBOT_03796 [Neisseria subflava NJ9703]